MDAGCWMLDGTVGYSVPEAWLWSGDTSTLAAELLHDARPRLPRPHKPCAAPNVRERQPRQVQAGSAGATAEGKNTLVRHNTMNPNDLILGYCHSRPTSAALTDDLSSPNHRLVRLTGKHLS